MMKLSSLVILVVSVVEAINAQNIQLEVQGTEADQYVIYAKANHTGPANVTAVYGDASSLTNGIGGAFEGGIVGVYGSAMLGNGVSGISSARNGVDGRSSIGIGVNGFSSSGIGVHGESDGSYGGRFINADKIQPDLVIGGNLTNANGIISSDPDFPGSSLLIRSNNALLLQLDHDNNSDGFFSIQNGAGSAVLAVGEEGDMALAGNSNLNRPHLLITETESSDFARIRLKSTSNTDYWDIAGGSTLNGQLNFYRSNVGNILQLNATGNPLTTSTGAYLSAGGMWTNNSSATLKHLEHKLDGEEILNKLSGLPLYTWKYKAEPAVNHLGPTAEDFYTLFNCGDSKQHLAPSDMAAVALAAIQVLIRENADLKKEIHSIKQELLK